MDQPVASGLLTAREVADELRVTYGTVLRWARKGHLLSVSLPSRSVRFHRAYIDLVLVRGVAEANVEWRGLTDVDLVVDDEAVPPALEVSDGGGV